MKKKVFGSTGLVIGLVSLWLTGCVGLGQYQDLEKEHQASVKEKESLTQEKDQLAHEKEALEKENSELLKAQQEAKAQYQNILGQLEGEMKDGQLKLTQYKNMLSVDVAEKVFFNSGSATLKQEGRAILKKVGEVLNQYPDKYIRVVGHTDNVPLTKGSVFASNWELSVARATNVVRFLQERVKVEPKRLVASGRAEFDPVASNETAEGRQKNRRIEMLLIDKSLFESTQPTAHTESPTPLPVTPTAQ